jgi:hypothetical protein
MIVYYKNNEIDRDQWDNCIKNSAGAKPYAYSWYLDIIAPGWEALVDDDYDSVFPIPAQRRFGIQYASTPKFIQQLGAYAPDKPPSSAINEFVEFMPENFKLTDLCVGQKLDYHGYKVIEKSNFELNLAPGYDKLWERFTPECRIHIAHPSKKKYEVTEDISPEELADLCLKNKGLNIRRVKQTDFDRIVSLMHYCISNKKGKISGVRATRKKIAYGVFRINLPGRITLLLEANTLGGIQKHIGYFVINEIIREYASTAVKLDFAMVHDRSAVNIGASFGATYVPYYRIYRNRFFWPARLMI